MRSPPFVQGISLSNYTVHGIVPSRKGIFFSTMSFGKA